MLEHKWLNGEVGDGALLAKTETLAGSKKGKSCLIFSGSYLAQYVDYYDYLDRPDVDVIGHNLCWVLPGANKFTYMLHGSRGYTHGYAKTCTTFNAFCKEFQGEHLFCTHTPAWANGPYPLPRGQDVKKAIASHEIENFYLFTQECKIKNLGYVPENTSEYKLSRIPAGCGGTLNAITLPFALKLGYSKIYVAGIGDKFLHHFYDGHILFKYGERPPKVTLSNRQTSLERYKKLAKCAKNSGSKILVMPGHMVEPSIKEIFNTAEIIP